MIKTKELFFLLTMVTINTHLLGVIFRNLLLLTPLIFDILIRMRLTLS